MARPLSIGISSMWLKRSSVVMYTPLTCHLFSSMVIVALPMWPEGGTEKVQFKPGLTLITTNLQPLRRFLLLYWHPLSHLMASVASIISFGGHISLENPRTAIPPVSPFSVSERPWTLIVEIFILVQNGDFLTLLKSLTTTVHSPFIEIVPILCFIQVLTK